MTVNRGKKHKYLGMTLNYSKERAFQITMFENLKSILETFENIDTEAKGTKKIAAPANYSQYKKTARSLTRNIVISSTALWHKCCSLINTIGLTQAQQSRFLPQ